MTMYSKRARKLLPILTVLIPIFGLISVVNVAVSMVSGSWLHSFERIPITNSTSTHEEFLIKRTISGLWNLWSFNLTEKEIRENKEVRPEQMDSMTIEYFRRDRYLADPNDSTNAIALSVTSSGPLFITAAILLIGAIFSMAFGYQRHRRVAIFVAGSIFIISGLIILIGLVVYLSVLQSEIGTKLRPRNSLDAPLFSYSYGYSFIMVVIGFLSTELTGIFAIFFYMYWHQLDWAEKAAKEHNNHHNLYPPSRHHHHSSGNVSFSSRSRYCCEQAMPVEWDHQHRIRRPDSLSFHHSSGCNHHHQHHHSHHHSQHQLGSAGQQQQQQQPDDSIDLCKGHEHLSRRGLSYDTEYDIPIPPPPPPASSLPRDYTTLTPCSAGDSFVPDLQLHSMGRQKCSMKDRRITPV